jgi:hypothetical protein
MKPCMFATLLQPIQGEKFRHRPRQVQQFLIDCVRHTRKRHAQEGIPNVTLRAMVQTPTTVNQPLIQEARTRVCGDASR